MSAYRKKAMNSRDALFGDAGGGGGGGKSKSKGKSKPSSSSSSSRPSMSSVSTTSSMSTQPVSNRSIGTTVSTSSASTISSALLKKAARPTRVLQGPVRDEKLQMAVDNKNKANQAMQKGLFSRPDPVAASTFFKRAADAYQQVGDMPKEERLYRLESAKCNELMGAWASAAGDYTRAAQLLFLEHEIKGSTDDMKEAGREASLYYQAASKMWTEMNEKAKAAATQIQAALALNVNNNHIAKESLTAMEVAIEAHVPDVLNRYARYRQTGTSAFLGPDESLTKVSPETRQLAKEHLVSKAYAHEPLQDVVNVLVAAAEYASALYAAGAASAVLENENMSTLSVSRAYCTETVLTLAMGDPITAQEQFLNRHVQKDFYLSSRECKLSEELFRAVLNRDTEALDEARSPSGPNRSALANMHPTLRELAVTGLRVTGVARVGSAGGGGGGAAKTSSSSKPSKSSSSGHHSSGGHHSHGHHKKSSSSDKKKKSSKSSSSSKSAPDSSSSLKELAGMKTGYEQDVAAGANMDTAALEAELDGLDFGDDSDDGLAVMDELDGLEDDDIDLR